MKLSQKKGRAKDPAVIVSSTIAKMELMLKCKGMINCKDVSLNVSLVMPALYSKLVEAKKGSLIDLTPSTIETPSYKSQSRILNRS